MNRRITAALGLCLALACLVPDAAADCYLHNPRGSNNRLNEANDNRANNNRLFDSQNNNEGGYNIGEAHEVQESLADDNNVGRIYYYVGSKVRVEWTNQHACNNDNMHCNMVLQYMCNTPAGVNAIQAVVIDDGSTTSGTTRGMHESQAYYDACQARSRNKGLFPAGRTINNNNGARATRQNPNGQERGRTECSEERDYYPYWHPTPWKDMVNFVDSVEVCSDFEALTSENTTPRYQCLQTGTTTAVAANTEATCTATAGATWTAGQSWGLAHPECRINHKTRDNHLGNAEGTIETPYYEWTVPSTTDACGSGTQCDKCIFRIRYNITVGDYDWRPTAAVDSTTSTSLKSASGKTSFSISNNNENGNTVAQEIQKDSLQLAFNTQQTGRVFQDRSHSFAIKARPAGISSTAAIVNINVRGRGGNIVACYPAVEYDFVPAEVSMRVGEYVHFQWTGTNANVGGNTKDRSNVVQIGERSMSYPVHFNYINMFTASSLSGKTKQQTVDEMAIGAGNNCAAASTADKENLNCVYAYQDKGLMYLDQVGEFHYMSTRNNDFTNRGHKGKISVS